MRPVPSVKAHAYGNDFLLAPDDGAVADPPAFTRAVCARHLGIGADGLILFTMTEPARHDAAVERRRQRVGALGQRPALPGGARRPRAGPARRERSSPSTPTPARRRSTSWRATARATPSAPPWGSRRTCAKPSSSRPARPCAPRCSGWATRSASSWARCRRASASTGSGPALADPRDVSGGHQRRVRAGRGARPGADSDLGARRRPDHVVRHRLVGIGGGGRGARRGRRDARRSWRPAARSASSGRADGVFLTGWAHIVLDGDVDGRRVPDAHLP